MKEIELPEILRNMSVETGSLVCLGCGHERSCSTRGCAILKDAANTIERLLDERAQAVKDAGIAWACRACKLRERGREWAMCKHQKIMAGPENADVCGNWQWRGVEDMDGASGTGEFAGRESR